MASKRKAPCKGSSAGSIGLDREALPMASIPEMFSAMLAQGLKLGSGFELREPVHFNIGTICSGTDVPVMVLNLLNEAFRNKFQRDFLIYHHQFSCEIEPFKQAFIRRNHDPPIIFRNVVELGAHGAENAMDASGCSKEIPSVKLDMLIAGTSCVDFSSLNNKKDEKTKVEAFKDFPEDVITGIKDNSGVPITSRSQIRVGLDQQFRNAVHEQLTPEGLESIGESMTTFLSTISFIMDRRPRIVILENVRTAPWRAMECFWLPRAGYTAQYVELDSKDFYIPQDRVRGYLVAMDAEEFRKHGCDGTELVETALKYALKLKQRPSSSVLDFLLEDDDPQLLQARDEIASHGAYGVPKDGSRGSRKVSDWDMCQLRHAIYALRWNLDTIRRFSKATLSNGRIVSISPPARSWIEYWQRETPRVIDLFDNLHQQILKRAGCDMRYKAALFNISQSLDRMQIKIEKFGIAPIITPAGMPTLTNLGRPLLGVECLTLQGIPRTHLRLAGETHRELRDLAGNAMTATVVGAVMLGTLMAAGSALSDIHRAQGPVQRAPSLGDVEPLEEGIRLVADWHLGDFRIQATSVLEHCGFRVCHCPLVGSHNRTSFRCQDCGKFACQMCKANPSHNFREHNDVKHTINIADLKVQIRQGLPGAFNMKMGIAIDLDGMLHRHNRYKLLAENDFYFSSIKVSMSSVTIEYHSVVSIARLVLTKLGDVDWYIYPRPQTLDAPSVDWREVKKPVAKGDLHEQASTVDPMAADWYVWEPIKQSWWVTDFTKKENYFSIDRNNIKVGSKDKRLPDLTSHIRDMVQGTWRASPQCGTACDSLYVRGHPSGPKAFWFKDVDPVGHPSEDKFIISTNIELADSREYRWDEVRVELLHIGQMDNLKSFELSVSGHWHSMDSMASFHTSIHLPKQRDSLHRASCAMVAAPGPESCGNKAPLTMIKLAVRVANLPLSESTKGRWNDKWHRIAAPELDEFFKSILFTANAVDTGHFFMPEPGGRFDPDRGVPITLCGECCVEPPQLRFIKGNKLLVPWEDPEDVRRYEARVKAMPQPFLAMARLDGGHDLRVRLVVNPRTLASRAAANLAWTARPRSYSTAILKNVQCSYQAEIGLLLEPNMGFQRFYDCIPTTQDNTGLSYAERSGNLDLVTFEARGLKLREDQTRSVKWMLAKEKGPAPFLETESEELVFEQFNLRLVGRATYENDGSEFCCRGGVVAHEIGYGKTVVMIALLELMRRFDGAGSLVQRCQAAARLYRSEDSFFHLKATLVIVPDHITTQWVNEFEKFGSCARITIIKKYEGLSKELLSDLKGADVIIVATSAFKASAYRTGLDRLRIGRPATSPSGREAEDRYRLSLDTIRGTVAHYHQLANAGNLSTSEQETQAEAKASELVTQMTEDYRALSEKFVPVSGRKHANKLQKKHQGGAADEEDVTSGEEEDVKPEKSARTKPKPLWTPTKFFENFSFARVIVDEFSYDNPEVSLFFANCLANAKWLLSGTPRCGNLADIVQVGRLLSVHVARPDPCIPTYLDPITVGPRLKPTAPSEEYRLRAPNQRSHNFAMDRHRAAETFVTHFVRQDKVDLTDFKLVNKKIELDLPILSRIAYAGLQHDLSMAKGNVFNLPTSRRMSLNITTTYSYAGDNVATGTKAGDFLMARFAAVPVTAEDLNSLLGGSEVTVEELKADLKTAMDKLVWLGHRISLVSDANRNKYPRHHYLRTFLDDIFTGMADARDSWNQWPTAPYGGRDAFHHLTKTLCPTTWYNHQTGGLENWLMWRYVEAKSFWPDWYDMPESYIDSLASQDKRVELIELSTDAILLSISHPLGRSFARTGGYVWLMAHAKVLGRVLGQRMRTTFLDDRQTSATEQARAAAVRDTVPRFTTDQLIAFLKGCMSEKAKAFDPRGTTADDLVCRGKQALQRHCLSRNLAFVDSNTALRLGQKILNYLEGKCTPKDFIDKRATISPRGTFPVPNKIIDRRGGKTEAMLEELTVTYNYFKNCQEAWINAYRRLRLYKFLAFVNASQAENTVEIFCGACLRQPVCVDDVPGFIVLACGHWLCGKHEETIDPHDVKAYCPAIGCGARCGLSHPATIKLTERDILECPDVWNSEDEARCSDGGKTPAIVKLIKEIPEDDKVIVFTYIDELAVSVRDSLVQEGITVLSMVTAGPGAQLASILEDFKDGMAKVIIIDPTAEHAAGSNLTTANHVVFASPVLERDAFLRQMHQRQAVGRCLREGQTKVVTVYTVVTKGTIDEEFFDSGGV